MPNFTEDPSEPFAAGTRRQILSTRPRNRPAAGAAFRTASMRAGLRSYGVSRLRTAAPRQLVSNDLTLDTFCINLDLCECRDDDGLSNTAERCGSGAADAGKVVAVAPSDPLDDAEVAEPAKLAGEAIGRELVEQRQQVGAPNAGDVDPRALQRVQQGIIDRVKEVDPLDGLLLDGARLGESVEGPDTGREIVERGEMRQIASVAA